MSIFKCKMCGGALEVTEGMTVCECEYCGTTQTVPKTHDDVTANLFNRANNLRTKCEFDKAQEIYEKIVSSNPAESEAYWGIILCKYGIEYVEDPVTLAKVPTCHRTQLEPVQTDSDYLSALDNADSVQRGIYEKEAQAIDILQKDILDIVHKEKPFDVFICYKESDENGKRTPDSVIANDIYHQLTQEGFKVFYAAITLEDKLGQAYEPYIFAALNSAKVMLAIGTRPEYFSAVWVKNEWSRYLKIMKSDRSKLLIPCYKNMDAYDLPEEFSHLQAQDMGKIGFINDVIRGIRKVLVKEEAPVVQQAAPVSAAPVNANVENLLKRGMLCLEDSKWSEAENFFEQVLNENVEEPRAYFGKLMAELRITDEEKFGKLSKDFSNSDNYKKACRFGDEAFMAKLMVIRKNCIYNKAMSCFNKAEKYDDFYHAREIFETIREHRDSEQKIQECNDKVFNIIKNMMKNAISELECKEALRISTGLEKYMDLSEIQEILKEKGKEIGEKNRIFDEANKLIKTSELENVEKGIALLRSIVPYRNSEDILKRTEIRFMRDSRHKEYSMKIDEINEQRKVLLEENKELGLFSGKRKKEIVHLLQELYTREEKLNKEYQDVRN